MIIQENIPLSGFTSLHVGGPAHYFASVTNDDELKEALEFATAKQLPFFILGKGSNTIFPDEGYTGLVIQMNDRHLAVEETTLTAASGVFMRPLVNFAHKHGLVGLEELAGIPGTVGGAVRGNAGTWQTDVKKVLTSVEILRPTPSSWEKVSLSGAECAFNYRQSIFKEHRDWIILRAHFGLQLGDIKQASERVAKDMKDRHERQPYDAPSAGSIFKNPDKENGIFSGALIESCGLKGKVLGGAQISEKHGNFILNKGGAKSSDIISLIEEIQAVVKLHRGIDLVPEVEIVRNS